MRKIILMLILCVPLAWTAWREGQRLYEVSKWSPPRKEAEVQQTPAADLDKIKKDSAAIVDLPDGVVSTIVRLDPPPPGFDSVVLDSRLLDHVKKRAQGRKTVDDARLEAADVEKKIDDMLKRMRGSTGQPRETDEELSRMLVEYEHLKVHDPELLASARAEEAWSKLNRKYPSRALDTFYEDLNRWSPGASALKQSGEDEVKAYREYLRNHQSAKGAVAASLVSQARERLVLWELGAKVVPLLSDPAKDRVEQVDEIRGLAEDNAPDRFENVARQLIQTLCGDLLKKEPPDKEVLLITPEAEPEQVQRKDIQVVLKNGETVSLGPPEPDEYSLQPDQIKGFSIISAGRFIEADDKTAPLKGTKYSDAVRAFNTERAKIKQWSEPALKKLRETCETHSADLARGGPNSGGSTLIKRIDSLLEIVGKHPNLFVTSTIP